MDEDNMQTSLDFETEFDDVVDASIEAHVIGIDEELFVDFLNIVDLDEDCLTKELQSDNDGERSVANKPMIYRFRQEDICKDFQWTLGKEFNTLAEFKDVVLQYSILISKEVKFDKNDKKRVRVLC